MIKIWIDDERPMPEGYNIWCRSVFDAIYRIGGLYLNQYRPGGPQTLLLDFDHDAGTFARWGGDYIEILKWLESWMSDSKEQDWLEGMDAAGEPVVIKIHFHSANPVGVKNMRAIVEHCPWMEEV